MRRISYHLAALVILTATFASTAAITAAQPAPDYDRSNANGRQLLVRVAGSQLAPLAQQYGFAVLASAPLGTETLAVIEAPAGMSPGQVASWLAGDARLKAIETQLTTGLPTPPSLDDGAHGVLIGDLLRSGTMVPAACPETALAALWAGYGEQEATVRIRLDAAQLAGGCGSALVAVIDTGVDPQHPVLAGSLVSGYDFLVNRNEVPSEWNQLGQSVIPIVEEIFTSVFQPAHQATLDGRADVLMLDAGIAPILDPASGALVAAQGLPAYFGHGTMVAGLVHLVAPGARIMPLRVFDGDGHAHLFDILRAIYYAVDHGADVINMSFSLATSSRELERAVRYARDRGVVCVAAAGNAGDRARVYPAALADVVGVASTDLDDSLSVFSNYGPALVTLAAPGGGVISTYPGGLYAAGWGTSFAAPLVAGTVALLAGDQSPVGAAQQQELVNALKDGAVMIDGLEGEIGNGRLDTLATVVAAGH